MRNSMWIDSPWTGFFQGRDPMLQTPTGVSEEIIQHIGHKFSSVEEGFSIHGGRSSYYDIYTRMYQIILYKVICVSYLL